MKFNNVIKDITSGKEREFYHLDHTSFININIDGIEDGESSFKECRYIEVNDSYFNLRYPFWHCYDIVLKNIKATENCRAAFWYCRDIYIKNMVSFGVKTFRECEDVLLIDSEFTSDEIGWRCEAFSINNSKITSKYGFFESKRISIDNLKYFGKYSFQYIEDSVIVNSYLDTKDAFWHAKNVIVKDSTIIGEYLGWYSENLTLVNCHIKGTQPLCYCKNLKLVDCTFEDADLAFEYSEVNGNIKSDIISIKNPIRGELEIFSVGEYIQDENSRNDGFILKPNKK